MSSGALGKAQRARYSLCEYRLISSLALAAEGLGQIVLGAVFEGRVTVRQ